MQKLSSVVRRVCVRFSVTIVASLALAMCAWGQYNASVQGTVTDPSGAAVPNAKVTVTNQATGVSSLTTTSTTGFYRIGQLPPGNYTVTVEASGFQKSETKDVVVLAEQIRGLDVKLTVGGAEQTVTVNGATTPLLQTGDATISGTLTQQEVQQLPKFGRDVYELVRLAPGLFGDGARTGAGLSIGFPNGPGQNSGSGGPGGSNTAIFQVENQQSISSNGQRITSNDYMVDGVSVNSLQWGGAAVITPSADSVQEITVVSNDYDASDGRNSGAHIKVVTKSGTNTFHGGGFFQYETPGLNAFNKFNGPGAPDVRVQDAFRQFGANFGGPIIKNKLFFFFNYEGLRDNTSTFSNQWVDTPQFDSLLVGNAPNTPVSATLQATGLLPRINQVLAGTCTSEGSLAITFPIPCQDVTGGVNLGSPTGTFGTYVDDPSGGGLTTTPEFEFAQIALPAHTSGNQYNVRVDYDRGNDRFSASTFLTYLNKLTSDSGAQGRPMADFNSHPFSPSGFLGWTRTISSSMVNDARFNFTRFAFDDVTANPQINFAIPRTEVQGALPFGQRVIFGAAQGDTSPGIFAQNTFGFRDVLAMIHNQHSFKFGFEFDREQDNDNLLGGARPDYVFQGPWNFANGAPIFEQIEVDPLTGGPTQSARYYRESDYGLFVQDDWKFRPNLTINLGLRWDYYGPPSEAKHNLENVIPPANPNASLADAFGVRPGSMYNPTTRNFGPKLGFAWSPTMLHNKAVLRSGFGIAYDRFDDVSFDNTRSNPPLVASYGICCGTSSNPFVNGQILYETGSANSPLGFAANPALATPIDPATNLPEILPGQGAPNVWSNPVNNPVPYIYEYSLQVQYALPQDWVATVGYTGSSSHKLLRIKNLGFFFAPPPSGAPPLEVNAVFTPTPDTNANYNALDTQVEHRFTHGLTVNFAYTYSKSIDQVSAEGPGFTTNQTFPTDDATERGPSDYDATHHVRAIALWDLPIFRGRNDLLGKTVGGWQVGAIFQFHSGFPWTPVTSNNCFTLGAQFLCPVRPTAYLGGAKNNHDTEAFLPPISGNFPNGATSYFTVNAPVPSFPGVGRNSFRGPRYSDFDFSLMKQFGLPNMPFVGEDSKIELRMDLFNAFNKLNLAPFTFGSASTTVSFFNDSNGVPVANPQFGTATSGLAGRVVQLQARFVF